MKAGFSKVAFIALITALIIAIYSFVIPKYNYENLFGKKNDSLLTAKADLEVLGDSLGLVDETVKEEETEEAYAQKNKQPTFSAVAGGDDFGPLNLFFAKLDKYSQKKIKKVRIAYFGDSITESDLSTNTLRKVWQDSLGGQGVGFVPAVSPLSQYRPSIKHTYSDNWTEYSISRTRDRKMPLGLYGNVAMPSLPLKDSLGVKLNSISSNSYNMMNGNLLAKPTLILLNYKAPLTLKYSVNQDTLTKNVKISDQLQFISLSDSLVKHLSISYYPQDTCFVYGVDFSDNKGVYIDNYSIRGNKGNNFIHLKEDILRQLFNYFKYDLTILHYGANVTDPIMTDYSWYRISMKHNIAYLKTLNYTQPMLLLGVMDRGALADSLWVSSPDLPYLIKEQKRIAKDAKIGFFNIFTALGGQNSNVALYDRGLLGPDHTHFTRKGSHFFGELLHKKFSKEYKKYQENKNGE